MALVHVFGWSVVRAVRETEYKYFRCYSFIATVRRYSILKKIEWPGHFRECLR